MDRGRFWSWVLSVRLVGAERAQFQIAANMWLAGFNCYDYSVGRLPHFTGFFELPLSFSDVHHFFTFD